MNSITNFLKLLEMKKTMTLLITLFMLGTVAFAQKTIKTYYDPYTKKSIKEQYMVNSKGLKHGNWKLWNKDGILMSVYNFSNGEKNGKCIDYWAFGENGGGVHCIAVRLRC